MGSTIKDVARLAGVSIATVSRVINNNDLHRVRLDTAHKVIDAAIALDYRPNENARNLKKNVLAASASLNFGILLTSAIDSYSDNFFHDILLGIQEEAANLGHSIRFSFSLGSTTVTAVEEALTHYKIDGIILLGRMSANILYLVKKNVRHILYAGLNPVNQDIDEVYCDGFECAKAAVRYLASCGYKKIGFIGTATQSGSSALINEYRYDGYISAMTELGLPVDKSYTVDTPLNIEMVYHAVDQYLAAKDYPEAFFCANDYCAVGAIKALSQHRIRIPQRVGIIGIDDIEMSAFTKPMLTTISIPRREIGIYSVRLLQDRVMNKRKYPIRMQLPFKLIERESCSSSAQRSR